ncbi:hypothetical protein KR084_001070 [Drosophila pseudotakahashii]|nr:hypothetical protein KR084_001070 [Drosophila pseudotakahashii]
MASQGNSESSAQKTNLTEETVSKCCFVITVGSNGLIEISSHNPDSKTEENGLVNDGSTSTNEASVSKKQRFSIAVLKEDSNDIVDSPSKTPEKINSNVKVSEETTKTEVVPRFVKICNKDLANRPSFVVLEDALARDRIKQELPKLDQDQKSTHVEPETGASCPKKSMASSNNVGLKDNAVPPLRKLSMQTAAQVRQKLSALNDKQTQLVSEARKRAGHNLNGKIRQQHYPTQQQHQHKQQQHQQPLGNKSPYVTISFLPVSQGATSNSPVMYPCQQFLSAAPSNMSCCSCCSCSNCCLPRATQVCPMPMASGCCQFQNPVYGSNCCMLRPPDSFPNSGSCCPTSDPSMRFGGQCSQHTIHPIMVTSACALQQQQQNLPVSSGFYPGCNHCSHYRTYPYPHHPCCQCPGFLNHQQMYQSQHQQQPPCVCCPLKPNQPGHPPSKGVKVLKATEKPINCDGVKHIFSKKPSEIPKTQNQEPFEYQVDQESKNKSSSEAPRSIGGAASSMSHSNCTSLYVARFGKTCLVLRPIRTAVMPRLLTKRISRYTSVIAWPAKNIKSTIGTN